jgi:hypothetical protein
MATVRSRVIFGDPAHIEPYTPWHAYAVKRMEMRALKDTALRGT